MRDECDLNVIYIKNATVTFNVLCVLSVLSVCDTSAF